MQQYVVDSYVKVEGNRLNFIRHNQKTLRVESYLGLADHINALATEAGMRAGVTVILPSTFIGSPRAMQQNYQDAMSIVRDYGKPDLFLTFTCNPKWKEIRDNLFPGQKPHDRPDLVARVFDMKKKALLQDLQKDGIFGRIVADIHVIEFQKRGLPHMHLLLILAEEDKIRDPETIDLIVSAELPDETLDPRLHEIVKSTMIHGPCGALNPNSPCITDGVCTKGYPKSFTAVTADSVNGYPMYRRRDDGNHVILNGNVVDNRWIIPYNPYLTKKYNAHINLEICSSIKSIKYVFKYVYKGHDCAKVVFEENGEGSVSWDEIKTFLDARYVSAPEAMWRLLEKKMHDKSHAIIRLPVHLPHMQPVYFYDDEERQALERAAQRQTMLTAWFELNTRDPDANIYLYVDIPKHFVWKNNKWERRVRLGEKIVSRLYSVSPKDIERFHLRMLLFHVPGAKSFEELRTFDGVTMESFKEACRARNLLEDDGEWRNCLLEACQFQMPAKLRQLFSFICFFCNPASPLELWEEFKTSLYEDFHSNTAVQESINLALHNIADHLHAHNMILTRVGLPEPTTSHEYVSTDSYDVETEKKEGEQLSAMLNPEQRSVFEAIMLAIRNVDNASPKTFCVNAIAVV
ncbi:uncharacterized protein LOC129216505 [Uloborus diversus]|uniref:uncharacterized protein LOC129216505 n=1 Tax=Uloborus diversus TaxID=327109 RepID=UPI002409DB6F|nr:uncharacterized protein LOC129216505 [Uloborus diversus]